MSFKTNWFRCPYALMQSEKLTSSEKIVILSLFYHLGQNDQSWPSQGTIAKETGLSKRWVIKTLKQLESKGILIVEREHCKNNKYSINESKILSPDESSLGELTSPNKVNSVHLENDSWVNSVHPLGELTSPNKVNSVHLGSELSSPELESYNKNHLTRIIELESGKNGSFVEEILSLIEKDVPAWKPKKLPALIGKWETEYGRAFTEAEIKKALLWRANNGKKYVDMGKFLGAWLMRSKGRESPNPKKEVSFDEMAKYWGMKDENE